MATGFHRSLGFKAFTANIIGRQRYELSKELLVLPSERAPHNNKSITVKQKLMSPHEPQMGLETETD
jgi:hypothetical protein